MAETGRRFVTLVGEDGEGRRKRWAYSLDAIAEACGLSRGKVEADAGIKFAPTSLKSVSRYIAASLLSQGATED